MKKRKLFNITKRTDVTIELVPAIGLTVVYVPSSRSKTFVLILPFILFELEIYEKEESVNSAKAIN